MVRTVRGQVGGPPVQARPDSNSYFLKLAASLTSLAIPSPFLSDIL